MAIRISPKDLVPELRARTKQIPKTIAQGMLAGAHRGRTFLVRRTPVDVGQMKNSWRVKPVLGGRRRTVELVNDAPHAGVIEAGARPHKVNAEGRAALERWAMRQLGVDENTAKAVAQGTIRKLERHGQKGHFIVRDNMDRLQKMVKQEVDKRVKKRAKVRAK